jgi:MATE family multidrug resistance protein
MFVLALPVVLAELGWMTMGIVDTLMVGRLSPEAIGAVGIGSSLFMAVGIFAMGLLLGLDTLVSQAFGAGRLDDCHRWLHHGIVMSLVLTVPVTLVLSAISDGLDGWGLDPGVLALATPYLDAVTWSVLPLLLYASFRRYLQGMGVVRPVMVALVGANLINIVVNWVLIFGKFGAPALGVAGAAWATVFSRVVMAGYLGVVIVMREGASRPGLFETSLRIDLSWLRRLCVLGFPAAMQVTLEVGVFAAATALAGRLVPTQLAAHQIAINLAALTFMVPLGVASAGAVRVGHAVGRGDPDGAARAGWTALLFGIAFMTCASAAFLLMPRMLIGAFTTDPGVLAIGVALLFVAAVFHRDVVVRASSRGASRGEAARRTPMLWNLAGHWVIGLPLGYALCFAFGLGVLGLWWGLSTGLIICGVALLTVWIRRVRHLTCSVVTQEG